MSLRIFISHSHEDNAWAESFADELNKYDVIVWLDRVGLRGGDHWIDSIQSELSRCDIFLVIVTPASLASRWVREETNAALNLDKRVISLVHISTPLPPFLATRQIIDANGLSPYQATLGVSSNLGVFLKAESQRRSSKLLEYAEILAQDGKGWGGFTYFFKNAQYNFAVVYTKSNGTRWYQRYNHASDSLDPMTDGIEHWSNTAYEWQGRFNEYAQELEKVVAKLILNGWIEISPGQQWYNRRFQREVSD